MLCSWQHRYRARNKKAGKVFLFFASLIIHFYPFSSYNLTHQRKGRKAFQTVLFSSPASEQDGGQRMLFSTCKRVGKYFKMSQRIRLRKNVQYHRKFSCYSDYLISPQSSQHNKINLVLHFKKIANGNNLAHWTDTSKLWEIRDAIRFNNYCLLIFTPGTVLRAQMQR